MINIIEIKDLDAPELQIYYNLNEAQLFHYFEPKPGIFIAESPKVIERALDAGCVPMSFLMEKKHVETQAKEILARCEKLQSEILHRSLWFIGRMSMKSRFMWQKSRCWQRSPAIS